MAHVLSARQTATWIALAASIILHLAGFSGGVAVAQNPAGGSRYETRQSDCRHQAPPGTALAVHRVDSGMRTRGYTAQRVLSYSADARGLEGGELLVCTEYGRVEIADSDDDQVRLQIRMEGFGEGSDRPGDAASRVIDATSTQVHMTAERGRLMVRVWHSTLGFTRAGGQPAWVNVRLLVPDRGAYDVTTEAFHGLVAVRRLTLTSAMLRGAVGEKFKGIPGFVFGTELDNVTLTGDAQIDNLSGIPGIRPPVPPEMAGLSAPILVKARVQSNSELSAVTGGAISIAIQPAPDLGVNALGESNSGMVNVMIDGGSVRDTTASPEFRIR